MMGEGALDGEAKLLSADSERKATLHHNLLSIKKLYRL